MAVVYTDEQPDLGETKNHYSLPRGTSARVKTHYSPPPPPAVKKRAAAASSSSKIERINKKSKTDETKFTTSTATGVVAGGGDAAVAPVEKEAYAKVTETLRKFNKYHLHFIQCVLSDHHDIKLATAMLVAADNIPRLRPLTFIVCKQSRDWTDERVG